MISTDAEPFDGGNAAWLYWTHGASFRRPIQAAMPRRIQVQVIVTIHSLWRWIVLLAAVLAIAGGVSARGGRPSGWASRTGLFYTIAIAIQVLLGLIVWVGGAYWAANVFLAFIHPITMLLALGVAHMGRGRERKAGAGAGLWAYVLSLLLLLLGIPRYAWHF